MGTMYSYLFPVEPDKPTANNQATEELHRYLVDCIPLFFDRYYDLNNYNTATMIVAGELSVVKPLCEAGADLNFLQLRGYAPIPLIFWNEELIAYFLTLGCDINARDSSGNTALIFACSYPLPKAYSGSLNLLIANSADPTLANVFGQTALSELIRESWRFDLLDLGANELLQRLLDRHNVPVTQTMLHLAFEYAG